VSADTLVPEPGNPQSLNRYAYTLNNPLRYTDPSGHRPCGEFCDPSEMGTTEDEPNPYVDLQPEIDTGYGEIIDFLVEPVLAFDWPRFEIEARGDSRYLGHISCWGYDLEIEFGQSLSGRLGHGRTWLLKSEKLDWLGQYLPLASTQAGQILLRAALMSVPFVVVLIYQLCKQRYRRAIWALILWAIWGVLV